MMYNTRSAINLLLARSHSFDMHCVVEIVLVVSAGVAADLVANWSYVMADMKSYRQKITSLRRRAAITRILGNPDVARKLEQVAHGLSRCEEQVSNNRQLTTRR